MSAQKILTFVSLVLGTIEFVLIYGVIVPFIIRRATFTSLTYLYIPLEFPLVVTSFLPILFMFLGISLVYWSFLTLLRASDYKPFDIFHPLNQRPQKLIKLAPYSVMRHPFVAGYLIFLFGNTLVYPSLNSILITLFFILPLSLGYIYLIEEPRLKRHYGKEYLSYSQKVAALFPIHLRRSLPLSCIVFLILSITFGTLAVPVSKTKAEGNCALSIDNIHPGDLEIGDTSRIKLNLSVDFSGGLPQSTYILTFYRKSALEPQTRDLNASITPSNLNLDSTGTTHADIAIEFNYQKGSEYTLTAGHILPEIDYDVCSSSVPALPNVFIPSLKPCGVDPTELQDPLLNASVILGESAANHTVIIAGLIVQADNSGNASLNFQKLSSSERTKEGTPVEVKVLKDSQSSENRLGQIIELCREMDLSAQLGSQHKLSLITVRTGRAKAEVFLAGAAAYTNDTGDAQILPPEDVFEGGLAGLTVINRDDSDPLISSNRPIFGSDSNLWLLTDIIDITHVVSASEANLRDNLKKYGSEFTTSPRGPDTGWQWPYRGYITTFFLPGRHDGLDIACSLPCGKGSEPLKADKSGSITYSGWDNTGFGNRLDITHDGTFRSLYGHLLTITSNNGTTVSQSEPLGTMGSTGNSSGPHVHYTIYKNGNQINPMDMMP